MEDINEIINNLSDNDIGKLRSLAGELFGSDQREQNKPALPSKDTPSVDPDMMRKVTRIVGMLKDNSENDAKSNFIMSLKPLLSDRRQEKADEAIRMMHLFDMLPMLKEAGLFK